MGVLVNILINAAALFVAAKLIPGIEVQSLGAVLLAALVFGVVNTFVKPLVSLLTLPITILTLGLFYLVINAGLLGLTAWLTPGFEISGFFPALFGAIVVSLVGMFLSQARESN